MMIQIVTAGAVMAEVVVAALPASAIQAEVVALMLFQY